ncbi:MAG: hypothetical protein EHM48_06610 [Planctomycetaceae bacterium]|nr:MAG: hypothetical protein EHM48_06610 [Planctomycetaceae bacterium]
MVLAGLAVAAAIGALAISMRRWHELPAAPKPLPLADEADKSADVSAEPVAFADEPSQAVEPAATCSPATRLFPGRLWLVAMFIALAAAAVGAWMALDSFSLQSLKNSWAELQRPENLRLTVHAIGGASILVIALILATLVRFAPRRKALTVIFAAILALAVTSQIYGGTLLLFDSQHGPLTGFSPAPTSVVEAQVESKSVPTSAPATQPTSAAAPANAPAMPTSTPASMPTPAPAVAAGETSTTMPTTAP